MPDALPLFDLNPAHDRAALAQEFARTRRLQVRDLLTARSAEVLADVVQRQTPYGLAYREPGAAPKSLRADASRRLPQAEQARIWQAAGQGVGRGDYGFVYGQYPMLDAYLGKWAPGHPLEFVLEYINAPEFLDFVRAITGMPSLIKADAQATLFAPNHFLAMHDDRGTGEEGRQIAYVLSLTRDWRPDWGGYLLFYDDEDEVIAGMKPRFNSLNLFQVPQRHNVSYVPPFAPLGRYAITGWFRDR
ncbi:2OG-Fe(II) oxygenase [Sphingomonas sp. PL-96]|uniref:2OG-Fe(II) oxygenase n=1 Tax=Sphingomonas sp. PL-96 TaxID=2887201 RepID=UPI001E3DA5A4|nr:2OG-Fe(II) oxygenase family protein [Sphingomonas sp. PL-96]MCC2977361.1 2OG-Fe(II) oxygenase [Sphingomonas sp. PL-96]